MENNQVIVDSNGVLKNLLAGNYNIDQIIYEYLNNVLSKNKESYEYIIDYKFRQLYERSNEGQGTCFIFKEDNAVGFRSLDQLKDAYQIAKSDRSGTNNMGNGIYSPLTINKHNDSLHLFVQNNSHGKFYSLAYFDSINTKLYTIQDVFEGTNIFGNNINEILNSMNNGTISMWFNTNQKCTTEGTVEQSIKFDSNFIKKLLRFYNMNGDVLYTEETEDTCSVTKVTENISKRYKTYLDRDNISIKYNDIIVDSIDILEAPPDTTKREKVYKLHIVPDEDSNNDLYMTENDLDEWCYLHSSGPGRQHPIGDKNVKYSTRAIQSKPEIQHATFIIFDYEYPAGRTASHDRIYDRKIWVEVDDTYICDSEVTLNPPNPNARFILKFNDLNKIDKYIALNANKSNSNINDNVLNRLQFLARKQLQEWNTPEGESTIMKYNFGAMNPLTILDTCLAMGIPVDKDVYKNNYNKTRKSKDIKLLQLKLEQKTKMARAQADQVPLGNQSVDRPHSSPSTITLDNPSSQHAIAEGIE